MEVTDSKTPPGADHPTRTCHTSGEGKAGCAKRRATRRDSPGDSVSSGGSATWLEKRVDMQSAQLARQEKLEERMDIQASLLATQEDAIAALRDEVRHLGRQLAEARTADGESCAGRAFGASSAGASTLAGSSMPLLMPPSELTTIEGTDVPLLVFINSRSGGRKGAAVINNYYKWFGEVQVCDLARVREGGPPPEVLLSRYVDRPGCRVLVGGGDGTCGWLLNAITKVCTEARRDVGSTLPIAVMPLGTGNDLCKPPSPTPKDARRRPVSPECVLPHHAADGAVVRLRACRVCDRSAVFVSPRAQLGTGLPPQHGQLRVGEAHCHRHSRAPRSLAGDDAVVPRPAKGILANLWPAQHHGRHRS